MEAAAPASQVAHVGTLTLVASLDALIRLSGTTGILEQLPGILFPSSACGYGWEVVATSPQGKPRSGH